MDRNVKQMLKLIEEDGDSFAKKAEMYYQKRPELISLVEDFYRGYRSLAERYDHVTSGEWSKNIPSDLQSQASGISDNGSETSTLHCHSPRRLGRRISGGNRAPGFDFFLGWGGNDYDSSQKDGGDCASSTLTDSDDEFDDASSINSYSGLYGNGVGDHGMNRRIMDLEIELREVKEKLWVNEEACVNDSSKRARIDNGEDFRAKINAYEQELRIVNQKLRLSEEESTKLKIELEKYRTMESPNLQVGIEEDLDLKLLEPQGRIDKEIVKSLMEELRITKEKLESSQMQIASLKLEAGKSCESIHWEEQVNLAQRDITAWKTKFNCEKRERIKIQERLERLTTTLIDRDNEIRDLKKTASDAAEKIYLERAQLKSEIFKLLEEQTRLEEHIREWECLSQSLEEKLMIEIEILKKEIEYGKKNIKDLNENLDALKLERDNLIEEVGSLKEEIISRDNKIEQLDIHLNHFHMDYVELISEMEEAQAQMEQLKSRTMELDEEIERQRTEIKEGAEEKREAIRQLCFSLEHYRNGYNVLRKVFIGHKRFPVLATKIYA
ncbi:hypothetical protein TanjilG_19480 [Lupinus angustifolius]|uniref:NAB domain-containing protein n=2 Tax=Lupinus angustifolius TaxID=3871 RepID=A0A1J7IIT9_LUPAN|nr:hypothetical protein TanjilG_19480 [Lupinus angustifolius]